MPSYHLLGYVKLVLGLACATEEETSQHNVRNSGRSASIDIEEAQTFGIPLAPFVAAVPLLLSLLLSLLLVLSFTAGAKRLLLVVLAVSHVLHVAIAHPAVVRAPASPALAAVAVAAAVLAVTVAPLVLAARAMVTPVTVTPVTVTTAAAARRGRARAPAWRAAAA